MKENLAEFLRDLPAFEAFSRHEVDKFVEITEPMKVTKGVTLYEAGDKSDCFYILESGVVAVKKKIDDNEILIDRIISGALFGEICLVNNECREFFAVCEQNCVLHKVTAKNFEILKDEMDPVAYKLLRNISLDYCNKIRLVNSEIKSCFVDPGPVLNEKLIGFYEKSSFLSKCILFLKRLRGYQQG